jgi:putative DNA primase/helicase
VFIGTTNATSYLQDTTGARRFPPLRVTRPIDIDALRRDREQLWAEAVHRFDAGESWWLTGDLVADAADEAEQRFVQHPWEAPIAAYLQNPQRRQTGVTTEEILASLGIETGQRTKAHAMTVGDILHRLGWERRRVRVAGGRAYLYSPKETP